MSIWGDIKDFGEGAVDFCADAADVAIEGLQIAGDVAEVAAPFVMCANPQAGMALMDFGQKMNQVDPYLDKAQSKLNGDESPAPQQTSAPAEGAEQGTMWHGKLNDAAIEEFFTNGFGDAIEITGDESENELLAKIFGKLIKEAKDDLKSAAEGIDKPDSKQTLELQAKAFDLQTLVGASAKIVSTVGESNITALGRTN
jgi:hypothetical protein